MTDLNERLAAMLDNEPPAPYDIDRVVSSGRRALRRRTTLTAVAGTAGTAAITAAVVVPIVASTHDAPTNKIQVSTQPTETPKCELSYEGGPDGQKSTKARLTKALERAQAEAKPGYSVGRIVAKDGVIGFEMCPPGAVDAPEETAPDPTAGMPRYHYTEAPQAIADRLGHQLTKQAEQLGFEIVYTRPFAQESSELEKGRPAYYGGNVDVRLPDGLADIGVQVTHEVTEQVPFANECSEGCSETELPDGSVLQVSHVDAGSGGAEVVVVEIHRPDGLVVSAQMSNYAFGPEATRDRTKHQPLTIDQLTNLATDKAWTF
jgi:hypothetical protein